MKKAWNCRLLSSRYDQAPTHQISTAHAHDVSVSLIILDAYKNWSFSKTRIKANAFYFNILS